MNGPIAQKILVQFRGVSFYPPSLEPGKLLTGWLTLKSVLLLPAAASSSHSLVVDRSRRRDVVITVARGRPPRSSAVILRSCEVDGFPLRGLPPRLLGALESESRGHADSALR